MNEPKMPSGTKRPTLKVSGLSTSFRAGSGRMVALRDVSFEVGHGQVMGLVGESGSGKSMTGYSIMGLLDEGGRVDAGSVEFTGRDGLTENLRTVGASRMRELRGNRISMIFQDPMMTLNPVLTVGTQMVETIQAHENTPTHLARERARQTLAMVGIASADERLNAYPHHFSGGMRQRVAIAIALLNRPDLIIADEPTTALDVTIQAQILCEMQKICAELGTAMIWITHDLSVVAGLADRISVMYAGTVVETGDVAEIINTPKHPYTQGLIACAPSNNKRGEPLKFIPGVAPSLSRPATGCSFKERCAAANARCDVPPAIQYHGGRGVCCHNAA